MQPDGEERNYLRFVRFGIGGGVNLAGADDARVSMRPLLELISDWAGFIGEPDAPDIADLLHAQTSTGRPLGPDSLVEDLEQRLRRALKRQKPRPKAVRGDSHTRDLFERLERDSVNCPRN